MTQCRFLLLLLYAMVAWATPAIPAVVSRASETSDAAPRSTGLLTNVVFAAYTPLSSSAELMRRLLSPLNARRTTQQLAHSAMGLRDQPIDLAQEKFTLYVPATPRPQGYGLLVFIPPWQSAMLPGGWGPVLDRHGVIFVSAANSGNEASILDRRIPLALLAAHNVMQRFRVDPERTYIGGFSGGARVALRVALAYPDVFRGALLNAGSDPVGSAEVPLPPAELLSRFQERTRIVYISGQNDSVNVEKDGASEQSLVGWCAFDVYAERSPWTEHEVAAPAALDRALEMLEAHAKPNVARLNRCRSRLAEELEKTLARATGDLDAGRADQARRTLEKIDARYGGLAAPRSVDLAARIGMD